MALGDTALGGGPLGGADKLLEVVAETTCTVGTPVHGTVRTVTATDGTMVRIDIDATSWPDDATKTITFGFERSTDGGSSWKPMVSATTVSGKFAAGASKPFVSINYEGDTLVRPFLLATGVDMTVGAAISTVK